LKTIKFQTKKPTAAKGFGLIELMIAVVILTVFVVAFLSVFPAVYNTTNQGIVMASELAKLEMERMKSLPWDKLEEMSGKTLSWKSNEWYVTGYTGRIGEKNPKAQFTIVRKVENYKDEGGVINPDVKLIVVEVKHDIKKSGETASGTRTGAVLMTLVARPSEPKILPND
jgi:prepilin-type N-terminal cleavage/methylation domain-containing protein